MVKFLVEYFIIAFRIILPIFAAMLLNNKHIKEAPIYKAILIIPWALPVTVAILSWQGLLNGSYGAINNLLTNLHIISTPIPWLTDPTWARVAVCMVNIWLGFPYQMNICLGALAAIPQDYYEAADVDGASKFTQFVKITLPSITQTAYPLIISSFSFNFNNFGSAYLITSGGPSRPTTQWAGYTDFYVPVSENVKSGMYELNYIDAQENVVSRIINLNYDMDFLKMTGNQAALAEKKDFREEIAVYSESGTLLFYGMRKNNWRNDSSIFSSNRGAASYRVCYVSKVNSLVLMMPPVYKNKENKENK